MDSNKPKYIEDQNEEELKRLQREEALSDSEEYDISDEIYNDAPVARQYVEDEEIAAGARFGEKEKQPSKPSAPNMVDDLPDSKPEPQLVAPTDKYIKKTDTSSAVVEKVDEGNTTLRVPDNKKQNNAISAIDDSSASKAKDSKNSRQKKDKTVLHSPLLVMLLVLGLTLLLCVFLFLGVSNFVSKDQKMNDEKSSFLKVVETVGSVTSGENAIAAELQKHTENFVLDLSDADQYHTQIVGLSEKINVEINKIASITTTNTSENNIKIAALDYLKNTQRMLEDLTAACSVANGDIQQIKEYILYNLDGFFVARDSSFEGLRSLALAEAQNLGIKATSDPEKIMLDIQK